MGFIAINAELEVEDHFHFAEAAEGTPPANINPLIIISVKSVGGENLGSLEMTAISLSIGALFAIRVRVFVIIFLSAAALIVSAAYAGASETWAPLTYGIKFVVLLQIGYVLGAAIHSILARK